MAVQTPPQADPVALRQAWIEARVAEFKADPDTRDRAIATVLYESMMLNQHLGEMMGVVQREGLGGLFKAFTGAMMNGRK